MKTTMSCKTAFAAALAMYAACAASSASAQNASWDTSRAETAPSLAEVKQATLRYRDINVALEEGYMTADNVCVTAALEGEPPQLGAMGVHYFRPDLLGITSVHPRIDGVGTHTDFTQPAILVYEPQPDGSHDLVAVENLVFAEAWHNAGNVDPPSFGDNQYYYMIDNPLTDHDEAHGFEPHYELHIWTHRENPAGMFMQFNKRVTCP